LKTALLFWSGGKDSAWTLREFITGENPGKVTALLTTYDRRTGRVPMHDVPIEWIEQQAKQLRLPLWSIPLPFPCSNVEYLDALKPFYDRADVDAVLFGDLFLEDIRKFREGSLAGTGLEAVFPLWGRDTKRLANEMIWGGIQAKITGIDHAQLDASFLGRVFNAELLESLPPGVDPCGENGEFHTFVQDPHRLIHR
jgi:uncharacterized protein (TIGR00290 family)